MPQVRGSQAGQQETGVEVADQAKGEQMTREEQTAELERIKKAFFALVNEAEGMFFTDNGYRPNAIVQSRNRFSEASMWLQAWINSQ
jgi:hypothetical protein